MAESSPFEGATSTNADGSFVNPRQALSTRLAKLPLKEIAGAIRKDDATLCKIRNNERPITITEFCALVELVGLKLVDKRRYCVPIEEFNFMARTTARVLANEATAREMFMERE